MRAVFINHLHPGTSHVGAARLREFAKAMAARGHRIVLLTQGDGGDDPPPGGLSPRLAAHDWSKPLMLACPPRPSSLLAAQRAGTLARPLRQGLIAWNYLFRGGVFPDWSDATRPWWPELAEHFRPDVVWATFGNTDCWRIAQGIAGAAGCPWVADIKDSWDVFIPAPLRWPLARRYDDCALVTGLSEGHLLHSGRIFPRPRRAVLSGFPAALLEAPVPEASPSRVTITGSLYSDRGAEGLAKAIGLWLDGSGDGMATAIVTYAGGDRARMERAAQGLIGRCRLEFYDFLPLEELARLQREAFINLYARHTGSADSFHHKLLELMAAGRPAACLPEEMPEALALAAAAGGKLSSCADAGSLAIALAEAWAGRGQPARRDLGRLRPFTWEGQAERLEAALAEAVAAGPPVRRRWPARLFAWAWVAGVSWAYLGQFAELGPALRRILGW